MKKLKVSILCFALVALQCVFVAGPVMLVQGCKSTSAAYKTAGSVAVTVDVAMTAWGNYVAANHPTAATEAQVKAAFDRYIQCMLVVTDVGKTLSATNTPANSTKLDVALTAAAASISDLTTLISSFGVKLK